MKKKIFILFALVMIVMTASAKMGYDLKVGTSEHGKIVFTVDGKSVKYADEGQKVTVKVTPDDYFVVNEVEGQWYAAIAAAPQRRTGIDLLNKVDLASAGENAWTFTMERANAEFSATYLKMLTSPDITVDALPNMAYSGQSLTPKVTVRDGETTLEEGTDYTVSYADNTNPGTATVIVTGKGNYTGEATAQFTIVQLDAQYLSVIVTPDEVAYNGSAQRPPVTVKLGETVLVEGRDYTLSYENNVNAGLTTVSAICHGNITGTHTVCFTITPAMLTEVNVDQTVFPYTGEEQSIGVTSVYAGSIKVPYEGFEVKNYLATEIGNYKATVTGIGNFGGSIDIPFSIVKNDNPGGDEPGGDEPGGDEPGDDDPGVEPGGNDGIVINVDANEADGNNDEVDGVKFNVLVDKNAQSRQEERTFVDPVTGETVPRIVTVVPVSLESIIIPQQVGASATDKQGLVVTVPAFVVSADGLTIYEVTAIKANAFVSNEPTATVTTVVLPDTEEPLTLEEGAMNTGNNDAMKVVSPLQHLDDYALDNALTKSYQALKVSAIVTPPNRYWSFSCGVDVVVPEGVNVYTCHVNNGKEVEIKQIEDNLLTVGGKRIIMANNGVLVACTDGTGGNAYEIVANPGRQETGTKPATNDAKSYGLDNLLEPVIESKNYAASDYYVLVENEFHPILFNNSKVPACKAVLKYTGASANARLVITVANGTTGIDASLVNSEERIVKSDVYDLNGRQVQNPAKGGVYIINNKKVVIKK